MVEKRYNLNEKLEVTCPFCNRKYKKDIDTLMYKENGKIKCECGAKIIVGVDFEHGRAEK